MIELACIQPGRGDMASVTLHIVRIKVTVYSIGRLHGGAISRAMTIHTPTRGISRVRKRTIQEGAIGRMT